MTLPYTVAVRELCEFTAKHGDLDLRFTPAPTAQEGMAGHAVAAARRGAGYRSEVGLTGQYLNLSVRGRADGFDPDNRRLDEVKTFKGSLERQPAVQRHLHWAQAKVYGWLLCQQEQWDALDVALVYLDIGSQQETVLVEPCSAQHLQAHFEQHCARFLVWAEQQLAHRTVRDAALQAMVFPYGEFRTGQRPLAEAVYRAAKGGRCLMAQAPTGIGKTMGTLFPLLKAAAPQKLDKVFFLTAKTSGRQVALQALERLGAMPASASESAPAPALECGDSHASAAGGTVKTTTTAAALPLRVLELVARDKACVHPDKACHGQSCPLALGFYDRLPAARQAALPVPGSEEAGTHPKLLLDAARVQAVALAHQVCPYYLSQELARWADVVVGDYNYYFDSSALLHHLAQANQWRVALLVDEAHNLVERGRKMYTAELCPERLALARRSPGARSSAPVRRALARVERCWRALDAEQTSAYAVHGDGFPPKLLAALQLCSTALGAHFAEHPEQPDAALQAFYFDALHLLRLAEALGAHSLVDTRLPAGSFGYAGHTTPATKATPATPAADTASAKASTQTRRSPPRSVVCIRNLVPAPFLQPRLQAAHTSTLFSATLQPTHYYADLLGLPERFVAVDVASPFAARQLQVQVARHISTRFGHRQASLAPSVELMARQFAEQPGNYLAFFSSYDHLQQVAALLAATHPQLPCWSQSPRMGEQAQRQFLERFTDHSAGIGFAVLGGSFAEGIDLPGRRLVGAFVSTLGLPQVNPVNEQVRLRMQALFGAGYDYTYLFPGLQKVVQAAGRVIRTPSDEGVVHLLDDRFARPEVQRLLPRWWTTVL